LSRGDLTDAEWRILNPLPPIGANAVPPLRTGGERSTAFFGFTGAPWRDMPERYGNWNSVFVRFSCWSKLRVWDAAFETLASLGPPADEEHAIDSTIAPAHQHAAGVKGGISARPLARRLLDQNPPPHERQRRAADLPVPGNTTPVLASEAS
jgi:transposase